MGHILEASILLVLAKAVFNVNVWWKWILLLVVVFYLLLWDISVDMEIMKMRKNKRK